MWTRACRIACSLLVLTVAACAPSGGPEAPPATSSPASSPPASPTSTPASTATSTPSPSPAPAPAPAAASFDLRAQRLRIPALGLDAPVEGSRVVPDTSTPPPGCPAPPPGQTTLTVPDRGLATPIETIEGLEHKAWIFGHSRWAGEPGLLFPLPRLERGDEVFVDGVDRATDRRVTGRRYVVDGLYLTDIESGGALVSAAPAGASPVPQVLLQTSVREDGGGKAWILDRAQLLAKAENLVQGDLDDPCKYLLLFVVARAS
ncbi:MAG: hypothetical protein AB7G21_09800 [Dehalococcoidia bacterium]